MEELFTVNIGYLYRLLRAHQKICYFSEMAIQEEDEDESGFSEIPEEESGEEEYLLYKKKSKEPELKPENKK